MSILKNGILWKDVYGETIHAHGGYVIFYKGYFYWYREDRRESYYVNCYRSKNLTDWEFRGYVLTNGRVLYYGDRWGGDGEKYYESGYVIYPLALEGERLVMEYVEQIEI